jgi:hypothetical protein
VAKFQSEQLPQLGDVGDPARLVGGGEGRAGPDNCGIAGVSSTMTNLYERTDYSVVVKNRAPPPKSWRWEIYRAGNSSPIIVSRIYFDTVEAARRSGKEALKQLLGKLFV